MIVDDVTGCYNFLLVEPWRFLLLLGVLRGHWLCVTRDDVGFAFR